MSRLLPRTSRRPLASRSFICFFHSSSARSLLTALAYASRIAPISELRSFHSPPHVEREDRASHSLKTGDFRKDNPVRAQEISWHTTNERVERSHFPGGGTSRVTRVAASVRESTPWFALTTSSPKPERLLATLAPSDTSAAAFAFVRTRVAAGSSPDCARCLD